MGKALSPVRTRDLTVPIPDVIEAWLKGRNAATRRAYLSDLGYFAEWAGAPSAQTAVKALLLAGPGESNRVIVGYRGSMAEAGLSSATINRRLAALRSMVKVGRLIGVINWHIDVQGMKIEPRRDVQGLAWRISS
jgi:integrase/recombinase XerC